MRRAVRNPHPDRPRLVTIGFVIQSIASVFGLTAMMFLAATAVRSGRGMETYRTVWLVSENWIGFLVFAGCALGALALGAAFRLRDYLAWRRLEKRSGDTARGSKTEGIR